MMVTDCGRKKIDLMFDKVNMGELEYGIKIFKAVLGLRTLVMGFHGIDVIFKLATLDQLDDVSNLNQSIWV